MSFIQVVTRASNAMNTEADAELAHLHLTSRRMVLLRALLGGPKRAVDLTEITGIDRSTIAAMIRTSADLGLLARTQNTDDNRAYDVALTPAGRDAYKAGQKIITSIERRIEKKIGASAPTVINSMHQIAGTAAAAE